MDNPNVTEGAEANGGSHSMERLGRMEGQKWRIDAEKWFGKLAVKAALDQATEKELAILDRLQRIRVPRSRAEIVAESRADWRMRILMKVLRREWRQALACNPTAELTRGNTATDQNSTEETNNGPK